MFQQRISFCCQRMTRRTRIFFFLCHQTNRTNQMAGAMCYFLPTDFTNITKFVFLCSFVYSVVFNRRQRRKTQKLFFLSLSWTIIYFCAFLRILRFLLLSTNYTNHTNYLFHLFHSMTFFYCQRITRITRIISFIRFIWWLSFINNYLCNLCNLLTFIIQFHVHFYLRVLRVLRWQQKEIRCWNIN